MTCIRMLCSRLHEQGAHFEQPLQCSRDCLRLKTISNWPENRPQVEQAQRQELKQVLRVKDQVRLLEFQEQVEAAGPDAVESLAPFMQYSVLRRIVQTFANAHDHSLSEWASNPRVLQLLGHAKSLLDEGRMAEKEMEHLLLQQLKSPDGPFFEEFKEKIFTSVVLPADMLVPALNEHLMERRQGNAAYKAGRLAEALACYRRALAIVDFIRGSNCNDQAEIDSNKVAVLLNAAAAELAVKEFAQAVQHCSQALTLEPNNPTAYLRRAKARSALWQLKEALEDLDQVKELDPGNEEVPELEQRVRGLQLRDRQLDRELCTRMFGRK